MKGEGFLVIAAKSTEIFFYRIIRQKGKDSENSKADEALQSQLAKLQQLRQLSQYDGFSTFWAEAPRILEPNFSISDFKMLLLAHLVPNATPLAGTLFT